MSRQLLCVSCEAVIWIKYVFLHFVVSFHSKTLLEVEFVSNVFDLRHSQVLN